LDPSIREAILRLKLVVFDFDGVFTDNFVYVFDDGREAVRCSRLDSLGLSHLTRLGIKTAILSKETNPVVGLRAKKLKMPCVQGCDDKEPELLRMISEAGLEPEDAAYMGNDINDIPCLKLVGLAVVVGDAHPDTWPHARLRTKALGGQGAIREFCDLVNEVRG
jgi:3-deoxy-D-manno-octulosonate 8-phosphate phosphatase (KDO 8-P phosphatase)